MAVVTEYGIKNFHTAFFRSVDDAPDPDVVITEITYDATTDTLTNPARLVSTDITIADMPAVEDNLRAFTELCLSRFQLSRVPMPPGLVFRIRTQVDGDIAVDVTVDGVLILDCTWKATLQVVRFPVIGLRTHSFTVWMAYRLALSMLVDQITGRAPRWY